MAKVFDHLKNLPTYSVTRVPKMGDVKRAFRLAGLLLHEGVNADADDALREVFVKKLKELRDKYAAEIAGWDAILREDSEIEIDITQVAVGHMSVTGSKTARLSLSEENIDQLFDAAGRMLAPGEGLHRTYWKRFHDKEKPNQGKVELFAVVRQSATLPGLEKLAKERFEELWQTHNAAIQQLPAAVKARFATLIQASGQPMKLAWELPEQIVEKKEGKAWTHHLFCDADGNFIAKLNGWETELLEEEMKKHGFVAWFRNVPRKQWALCISYELAGLKPFYPDFVIVRKSGSGFIVDVIEPHDDSRTDTWAKTKGLAEFADKHGMDFGRLIIARKKNTQWQMADVNDKATRQKARRMQSSSDLESIFS